MYVTWINQMLTLNHTYVRVTWIIMRVTWIIHTRKMNHSLWVTWGIHQYDMNHPDVSVINVMTHQCDMSHMNVTLIQTSRRECRGPFVYMGHESSTFVRWIIHKIGTTQCIALVTMCAFLHHLNVWQDSFFGVWHDTWHTSFILMTLLSVSRWSWNLQYRMIHMYETTHTYVCDMTHANLWRDSACCAMLVSMLACFNMQGHIALQHTATHCTILQHSAQHCNTLHQYVALVKMFALASMKGQTLCAKLHHTATHCKPQQQRVALVMILTLWNTRVNSLQCTSTHCETLPHTAKHGNTLQHTATHLIVQHGLQMSPWHITHQEWVVFVTMLALLNMRSHTHCNSQQHTATHCNTLQHTAQTVCCACVDVRAFEYARVHRAPWLSRYVPSIGWCVRKTYVYMCIHICVRGCFNMFMWIYTYKCIYVNI